MALKRVRSGPRLPRLDGEPRRPYSSVNVRFEEKVVFDVLHAWWRLGGAREMAQIDAFSRVLALALEHPRADVPPELARSLARKKSGGA